MPSLPRGVVVGSSQIIMLKYYEGVVPCRGVDLLIPVVLWYSGPVVSLTQPSNMPTVTAVNTQAGGWLEVQVI